MNQQEFYIGWQAKAPDSYKKQVRKAILFLAFLIPAAAIALALFQKKFSTATFEFGTLTEVKGVYVHYPVPFIKAVSGKDIFGNSSYITIPLVGYGKFGAAGIMADLEKEKGISLDKKEIILKGTLLYSDGKVLMQVDGNDQPLVSVGNPAPASLLPESKEMGTMTIKGEVVDPKCYFGVMKPGQGKPHKDCAIRCILGGIPPVLRVTGDQAANYYLLLNENGERMNETVKKLVAEPASVTARVVQYDDWVILYVKPENMQSASYLDITGQQVASCMNPSSR